MNIDQFIKNVNRMREQQIMYDRTKHSVYFREKKKYESEVDRMINEFKIKKEKQHQKNWFDEHGY